MAYLGTDVLTNVPQTYIYVDTFSGNGSSTQFTLSNTPNSISQTIVHVSGVYKEKALYTLVGNVITFNTAPASGTNNIEIMSMKSFGNAVLTGDTFTNTTSSVAGEVALFADASGKIIKRATGTGLMNISSGVASVGYGKMFFWANR